MRLLVALLVGLVLTVEQSTAADPVVLCQRGKRTKLRTNACKKKELAVGLVTPTPNDVRGIWKHRAGGGFANDPFESQFLVFNADGSGRLTEREPTSHIIQCRSLRYGISANWASLIVQPSGQPTQVMQMTREGDVLIFVDDSGTGVYDRVEAVDAAVDCGPLTEVSRLTGLPGANVASGLIFTGSSFTYRPRFSTAVAVNASTGQLLPAPNLSAAALSPYTRENDDVWGTCSCGSVDDAARVNPTTGALVDTVHTDAELGHKIFIRAMAVPSNGKLLLQGIAFASNKGELLLANTAGEPNTLISAKPFPVELHSLAIDGATAWGLLPGNAATILRIDPDAGTSSGSYQLPLGPIQWIAMTAADGKLFVIGNTPNNDGVLATFNQPS